MKKNCVMEPGIFEDDNSAIIKKKIQEFENGSPNFDGLTPNQVMSIFKYLLKSFREKIITLKYDSELVMTRFRAAGSKSTNVENYALFSLNFFLFFIQRCYWCSCVASEFFSI